MILPYKLPIIVRSKNGDWFVKYWYEYPDQPGVYKEFRVRDGVNRIYDLEVKEKEILKLRSDIKLYLESGKHEPFKARKIAYHSLVEAEEALAIEDKKHKSWTMEHGMAEFMKYCTWKGLSDNTTRGYRTFINNFTEWLTENNQLDSPACEYLETDYVKFADTFSDAEDWEPRTYNNHIKFLITLFSRIEKEERKIDRSVRYHINLKDLEYKTDKAEKNRAYSGIVAERVKKELDKPEHSKIKPFVQFIYLSCMRPKEIRMLRIEHIDTQNRQIKVAGPVGKTGDRFVPISDELLTLLQELNFQDLPLNYYLFGKLGDPGEVMCGRTYYSDLYRPVKESVGLDIYIYTMYGWKHTRVIDLINAGFSDEEVMKLTGHTDYQSFLAYKRDLMISNTLMKGKTLGWIKQ